MNEKQEFTKGMIITIPTDLKYTKQFYGISEPMKQFIGTSQMIDKIIECGDLIIKRWYYDKRDFKIPEASKDIKPVRTIPETSYEIKPTRKVLLKDLIGI